MLFKKESDLMPRTYTIKGYSKKESAFWRVLKLSAFALVITAALALVILFIVYTI